MPNMIPLGYVRVTEFCQIPPQSRAQASPAPYLRRNVLAELGAGKPLGRNSAQLGEDERHKTKERRIRFRQSRNINLGAPRTWLISRPIAKPLEKYFQALVHIWLTYSRSWTCSSKVFPERVFLATRGKKSRPHCSTGYFLIAC
jgi:hypothetical protein